MQIIAVTLILAARLSATARACDALCSPAAVRGYGYLLASTGFTSEVEHAAFVVRDADGSIHFVRWNSQHELRAKYTGVVPDGCVAIAHTHPYLQTQPSPHDIDEAQRIHIPIIVITPVAVTIAHADGNVETLFSKGWLDRR